MNFPNFGFEVDSNPPQGKYCWKRHNNETLVDKILPLNKGFRSKRSRELVRIILSDYCFQHSPRRSNKSGDRKDRRTLLLLNQMQLMRGNVSGKIFCGKTNYI